MALKLRVVSEQRRALGDRASIVVGVGGGSIGRSADNDWVLPDPMRYISGRHARIHFRLGAYYLEDVSTNGIFVNDADRPISRQGLYLLKNGDLVRVGDYQLLVTLEESAEAAEPAVLSPDAADTLLSLQTDTEPDAIVVTPVAVPESAGSVAHTDIGASLNLQALIERPPPSGAGLRSTNARGQALAAQLPELEPETEPEPHIVPGEAVAR
ncbi:MAG: FHA domain-containing protein, partial [Steroidobacteraceae bacterium]